MFCMSAGDTSAETTPVDNEDEIGSNPIPTITMRSRNDTRDAKERKRFDLLNIVVCGLVIALVLCIKELIKEYFFTLPLVCRRQYLLLLALVEMHRTLKWSR